MRILITGAQGMLGSFLVDKWKNKYEVYATDIGSKIHGIPVEYYPFDLEREKYDDLMNWAQPEAIVHCAAITNVDYCETHYHQAMNVNAESVSKLLQFGKRILFVSSDAVFPDGVPMSSENDRIEPQNIYGKSKELGEKYIVNAKGSNCAIRTTIVGKNVQNSKLGFLGWMINSLKSGQEVSLFHDNRFSPITIWHFADELEFLLQSSLSGVMHVAGREPISKYDFGVRVCERLNLDTTLIKAASMDETQFIATRSKDQTLSVDHYQKSTNRTLPDNSEAINHIVTHFKEV